MNSLSIIILLGILVTISYGFSTNCTSAVDESCTVWLTAGKPAYQIFSKCLTEEDKKLGVGVLTTEAKPSEIEKENNLIKNEVSKDAKETFFGSLNNIPYASNRDIVIVSNDSNMGNRFKRAIRK
uniref:Uncharacterized protein n=1 Tax=Strongyloides venezuelensis TaxID=75913 RepID=A0A0K0FIT9_STRVS